MNITEAVKADLDARAKLGPGKDGVDEPDIGSDEMLSLLETAAKAVYENYVGGYAELPWPDLSKAQRRRWIASTRAALESLMEPTEAMVQSAVGGKSHLKLVALGIWQAILGKVLEG